MFDGAINIGGPGTYVTPTSVTVGRRLHIRDCLLADQFPTTAKDIFVRIEPQSLRLSSVHRQLDINISNSYITLDYAASI